MHMLVAVSFSTTRNHDGEPVDATGAHFLPYRGRSSMREIYSQRTSTYPILIAQHISALVGQVNLERRVLCLELG